MNEERFKTRMEERCNRHGRNREIGRVWGGLFMLIVGGLLLAKASGIFFPAWFFSWPVFLIGIGLFSGVKHKFHGLGWLLPIVIGGVFLADRLSPEIYLRPYLWPMLLIGAGLFVIFRPKGRRWHNDENGGDGLPSQPSPPPDDDKTFFIQPTNDSNAILDVTAVFGGVKKNVVSKSFKGGDITAFMGGAEINFMQADFTGKITIDTFNMFGGTKLIIPADWEVQSNVVAIFGGVDDKRPPANNSVPEKVLYLDGTCIFGGLEIKSY